jgi:glutathione S-transferase
MYKLYYSPGSASFVVHWMLLELAVPYELERVNFAAGEQKRPEFLRLNARGHVPVLVVDGRPYTESAALLMILAERHPEARLCPAPGSPERYAFLEAMVYLANELLPAFRAWFYVDDFASPEHHEDALAHARARIEAVWSELDRWLSDGREHLLGADLTTVDLLATMLARWGRRMPRAPESWPQLGAYVARMKKRPKLREVHAREGLTEWIDAAE